MALFFTKLNARVLRPGLSRLFGGCPKAPDRPPSKAIQALDQASERLASDAKLAA